MGWGSLLGNFAKEFAKGYVQERGIKRTLEDVSSVASGLFSGLSTQEADEDDWNELYKSIEERISSREYIDAIKTLDRFYNEYMDGEDDSTYFYLRSLILVDFLESQIGNDDFDEILDALSEAIKEGKSFEDEDFEEEFEELEQRKSNAIDSHNDLIAWFELTSKCSELCQTANFNEAENLIEDWYKHHDDDIFLPYMLAQINIERHKHDLSEGKLPPQEETNGTEYLISEVAKYEDSAEHCKELRDSLDAVNVRCASLQPAHAPKEKEQKTDNSPLSDSEKEYLDEVTACLKDDGEITARERRLLDKLCSSLGISAARAAELEAIASGKSLLTDSEKEYLDEYEACLDEDGIISERERRLLDRLAKSLNISLERVREIEADMS